MRLLTSLTLAGALALAHAAEAHADRVARADDAERATRGTPLRDRPGETARVVKRVPDRAPIEVLASQGRWVKVRHDGKVGWMTRAQVAARGPTEKKARKRPARSGWSGREVTAPLEVVVRADRVRAFDDPSDKRRAVFEVRADETLSVLGTSEGDWLLVENAAGQVGWLPRAAVRDQGQFLIPGAASEPAEIVLVQADDDVVPGASSARARATGRVALGLRAGAGVDSFGRFDASAGAGAETLAVGFAPALAASAEISARVTGSIRAGVAVDVTTSSSADGLQYYAGADGAAVTYGFARQALRGHGMVSVGERRQLALRAGYLYETLALDGDAAAGLVGEQVGGLTVGVAGRSPLAAGLHLELAIDAMPAGAQRPDERPASGVVGIGATGAWASAILSLPLPYRLAAHVGYRFGLVNVALGEGEELTPVGERADQSHTAVLGVGLAL